jgi:phage shock protein A
MLTTKPTTETKGVSMSLLNRIQMFIQVKTQSALDRLEDPRETLEQAYARQQEMLRRVKLGLLDVATARRQLQLRAEKQRARAEQLSEQAERALAAGREDLARAALQRKQVCLNEVAQLEKQAQELGVDESKLAAAEQRFAERVEAFRARRTSLAARYAAAEAQVRVAESVNGLSAESAELGAALERTEDKIERMQARAAALDALIESGAFTPPDRDDAIDRELNELAAAQAIEAELAALKSKAAAPRGEPQPPTETRE